MTLDRAILDAFVASLNARRRPEHAVKVESFEPTGAFVLSFPDRPLPPEECIDQDFTEIQFALLEARDVTTQIVSGEKRDDDRYHMRYEIVRWD